MKTKNKILVVDDKGINRYMLGNIFREEYEIVEASGGQMAIDVMETEAGSLAVVLLDIIMPCPLYTSDAAGAEDTLVLGRCGRGS